MKRSKSIRSTTPAVAKRLRSVQTILNPTPTKVLKVLLTGGDGNCELGLGPAITQVKRPRENKFLTENKITEIAAGAMHVVALDNEGAIWTWGQNDGGALGRPTPKDEPADASDSEDDDAVMNRSESTPTKITSVPAGVQFADVAATDNLSVAVTVDGKVWAWGTFINDSTHEFIQGIVHQNEPYQLPGIRGIVKAVGGSNHVLFLDKDSKVWAWGTANASQLGAPLRESQHTIVYGPFKVPGLRNIVSISAGEYQSFAIDTAGRAYAWGLNNFGQCAVYDEGLMGDGAVITKPVAVDFGTPIKQIASGGKFSLFLTQDGKVFSVGENNFNQLGVDPASLDKSQAVFDTRGKPQYALQPIHIQKACESVSKGSAETEPIDLPTVKYVACGTDHAAIVDNEGSVYTWGIGETYQLGHGKQEDEAIPRKIWNTATEDVEFEYSGAGGQFTFMAAYA